MASADIYGSISTRSTPQTEKAAPEQVRNSAGGFTFAITPLEQAKRFLVLGSSSGSYYSSAADLTKANADVIIELARTDHKALVDLIVDVSTRGLAPKVQPALLALAVAVSHGTDDERRYALASFNEVVRTGFHLFTFARYVEQFRGWGRGLKRAVATWYTSKDPDSLAYQAVKYRQRDGWSHRDLLRLSHPSATDNASHDALFEWITKGNTGIGIPDIVTGFKQAQQPDANYAELVRKYRLSWEMLPTDALTQPTTWNALIDAGLPQTALMRQLPRLTRLGVVKPMNQGKTPVVAAQLKDPVRLHKARVHPLNVLKASTTYAAGRSVRGDGSTWAPVHEVVDALDSAFYAAFKNVEPANKRTMVALDVSGSMSALIADSFLSAREASAAMAMVTIATEPQVMTVAFTGNGSWGRDNAAVKPLTLSPRQRLGDVVREISRLPFGRTDCALPMLYAIENNLEVDTFVIYTDNETWYGRIHPHQALKQYREHSGINAKLVVVGMTATEFSIADPSDPGMLDVVGFDSSAPALISEFSRGL